tara:strand:- start:31 stop:234 length:204 start_codon:yes stop_codon:yes gene_type:complete
MTDKIALYGWEVSPYTAKVRAYFAYKNICFKEVRPNIYTLARKIQPATGKMIMPVVYINDRNRLCCK